MGAFYLFAINTLFIMLSAAFMTKLLKVPAHEAADTILLTATASQFLTIEEEQAIRNWLEIESRISDIRLLITVDK